MMDKGDGDSRQEAFHKLVGRGLTDSKFRDELSDPDRRQNAVNDVLQGTGIQYADIEEELEAAVGAIEKLAQQFDPDLRIAS
jgi:hypothetical protein